jgi:hypothetical protein
MVFLVFQISLDCIPLPGVGQTVISLSAFTKRQTNARSSPTRHWQAQKSLFQTNTHETNEKSFFLILDVLH